MPMCPCPMPTCTSALTTKSSSLVGRLPWSPPRKSCCSEDERDAKRADERFSRCSRCRVVWFCRGTDCQRLAWGEHKKVCRKPSPQQQQHGLPQQAQQQYGLPQQQQYGLPQQQQYGLPQQQQQQYGMPQQAQQQYGLSQPAQQQ